MNRHAYWSFLMWLRTTLDGAYLFPSGNADVMEIPLSDWRILIRPTDAD